MRVFGCMCAMALWNCGTYEWQTSLPLRNPGVESQSTSVIETRQLQFLNPPLTHARLCLTLTAEAPFARFAPPAYLQLNVVTPFLGLTRSWLALLFQDGGANSFNGLDAPHSFRDVCFSDDASAALNTYATAGAAEIGSSTWLPQNMPWNADAPAPETLTEFFNKTMPFDSSHSTGVQIQWSGPNGTTTWLEAATLQLCTGEPPEPSPPAPPSEPPSSPPSSPSPPPYAPYNECECTPFSSQWNADMWCNFQQDFYNRQCRVERSSRTPPPPVSPPVTTHPVPTVTTVITAATPAPAPRPRRPGIPPSPPMPSPPPISPNRVTDVCDAASVHARQPVECLLRVGSIYPPYDVSQPGNVSACTDACCADAGCVAVGWSDPNCSAYDSTDAHTLVGNLLPTDGYDEWYCLLHPAPPAPPVTPPIPPTAPPSPPKACTPYEGHWTSDTDYEDCQPWCNTEPENEGYTCDHCRCKACPSLPHPATVAPPRHHPAHRGSRARPRAPRSTRSASLRRPSPASS